MAKPAGGSTDIAEGTVRHGRRIAETWPGMDTLAPLEKYTPAGNENGTGRLHAELL
jgi:hypothetical protein